MKKTIYYSLTLAFIASGLISAGLENRDSIEIAAYKASHAKNASGAPAQRTGAPGEQNCTACHAGSTLSGDGVNSITMLDGSGTPVTSYFPDSTYTVAVTINDAATKKGFQLVGLKVSDNTQAGAVTGSAVGGTSRVTSANKQYINQTGASTGFTTPWTFTWTAPASNVGDVRFYMASNASNSNNGTGGDKIYLSQHTFSADATASVDAQANKLSASIYHAENQINIQLNSPIAGNGYVNIIDLNGKSVAYHVLGDVSKGTNSVSIPVLKSLTAGTYIVHVLVNNMTLQQKIVISK